MVKRKKEHFYLQFLLIWKDKSFLKYLSAEISFEKSKIIQGQKAHECRVLCQKLGYDICPYLSFFARRFEDEIFDLTGRRNLNTKYTNFGPKMIWNACEMLMMQLWMHDQKWLDWEQKQQRDTQIRWRKGSDFARG